MRNSQSSGGGAVNTLSQLRSPLLPPEGHPWRPGVPRLPPGLFCPHSRFNARIVESASVSACCSSRRPLPVSRCNLLHITVSISRSFVGSKRAFSNGICHCGYFNSVFMSFLDARRSVRPPSHLSRVCSRWVGGNRETLARL